MSLGTEELKVVDEEVNHAYAVMEGILPHFAQRRGGMPEDLQKAVFVAQCAVFRAWLEMLPSDFKHLQKVHDDTLENLRQRMSSGTTS